jgi:NADPH-dependent 2,4-dienoyl-CoA reductase/sulfur reductase-like enzyme
MDRTELAVIGAGPAGLAAAISAAQTGVQVTLIDEYPRPGGQYLQGDDHNQSSSTERRARALLTELSSHAIEVRTETLVWGLEDKTLALYGAEGPESLKAQSLILATGARERVLPFPGWTLPGVMTVGGAQRLAKVHGVLPGDRILLAGSGPLLLPAALELSNRGGSIVGILEATRPLQWLPHLAALSGNRERIQEAWQYARSLFSKGISYRFGQTVIRALGGESVEAAVVARLDPGGRPIPGTEETLDVDTVGVSFGFIPNVELTRLAGCEHRYAPEWGGWIPTLDENMETTLSGVYAVGEAAGVGGAGLAMLEGHLAGLAVSTRLGRLSRGEFNRDWRRLARQMAPANRFGVTLNTLFHPRPGLDAIATDDTLLCRCEEVSVGETLNAVSSGDPRADSLKNVSRIGQGPCQGRTCGPLLTRLMAGRLGLSADLIGTFRVRPPLKPIPLAGWANWEPP